MLTLNAYYHLDKVTKTFDMLKNYGPDGKILACPGSELSVYSEKMKLYLSHFHIVNENKFIDFDTE